LAHIYIASGIIVKNCRCSLLPVAAGEDEAIRPEEEPKTKRATTIASEPRQVKAPHYESEP